VGREGRGKGGKGRGGERGRNVEGPGKWSAPGPALALGGPEFSYDTGKMSLPNI